MQTESLPKGKDSQTVDKVAKTRRVIIIVIEAISYSKDDSCQSKTQNSYHLLKIYRRVEI